jgi:hypothetical protein
MLCRMRDFVGRTIVPSSRLLMILDFLNIVEFHGLLLFLLVRRVGIHSLTGLTPPH